MTMPNEFSIAFLSTPSLYFSLPEDRRSNCHMFDYDMKWASDRGFVHYDFNDPDMIPDDFLGRFDAIVIDPPFITEEVWRRYAVAVKKLSRNSSCEFISCVTI